MDRTRQTLTLADGRTLGFAEYGAPGGVPVLYCTGGNNSRLEAASYHGEAERLGVRLVSPDRPGVGLSDIHPGRTFLDWPEDAAQLVDALRLEHFALLGLSGGSPHLLATAYRLPERVLRAAVVSGAAPLVAPDVFTGMWPPIRVLYFLARRAPLPLFRAVLRGAVNPTRNFTPQNIGRMRPPETEILTRRPELVREFSESMIEAHRPGIDGAAQEWRFYVKPWGFPLEDIATEVRLWYGEQDGNAPPSMGRYLHQILPYSTLTLIPDEAHLSLINNHIGRILENLIAPQKGPS